MSILEPKLLATGDAYIKTLYRCNCNSKNIVRTNKLAEISKKWEQIKNILKIGNSNIKNFTTIIYAPFENLLTKRCPGIYIRLVQVTENHQRLKLFSPLTGKNVSWKLRHNKNILRLRTLIIYKKGVGTLDELGRTSKIRRISIIKR